MRRAVGNNLADVASGCPIHYHQLDAKNVSMSKLTLKQYRSFSYRNPPYIKQDSRKLKHNFFAKFCASN